MITYIELVKLLDGIWHECFNDTVECYCVWKALSLFVNPDLPHDFCDEPDRLKEFTQSDLNAANRFFRKFNFVVNQDATSPREATSL